MPGVPGGYGTPWPVWMDSSSKTYAPTAASGESDGTSSSEMGGSRTELAAQWYTKQRNSGRWRMLAP